MSIETETHKRLTHSDIIRLALTRPASSSSHVGLQSRPGGETVIDVVVTVADAGTLEDAKRIATETYNELRTAYPLPEGSGESSSVALSRNSKGETQMEVTARGDMAPELVSGSVRVEYDRLRTAYPMASGFVGAQPAARDAGDGGKA